MGAVTEYAFQGPKRGADRAVLLAHGAGADMNAAALTVVADALADARVATLRFNFPYKSAGRRSPDRPAVLEAAVREAAAELSRRTKLAPEGLVLGGRSMGGRICSVVAADADDPVPAAGLLLLGYPLHPPGKPDQLRVDHFPRLRMPVLFASGTRDSFASPDELRQQVKAVKGRVSFHWIESGDHGFKPLKASGLTVESALAGVADAVVAFVASLP
jgi:predicted alpha/beta-hydrolase family hydrolase